LRKQLAQRELTNQPFPLVANLVAARGRETPSERVGTIRVGIERALAFLVAVELAGLCETDDAEAVQAAAHELHRSNPRSPMAMGTLRQTALRLAPHLLRYSPDPTAREFAKLAKDAESPLCARRLDEVVTERNTDAHGCVPTQEIHAKHEVFVSRVFDELLDIAVPLSDLTLVSPLPGSGDLHAEEGTVNMFHLRGAVEPFPQSQRSHRFRFLPNWCYMLRPSAPPLPLVPFVAMAWCQTCRRREVFVFRCFDENAKKGTRLQAVTTGHAERLDFDWDRVSPGVRLLLEATASIKTPR